jgi:hypothetical protein
VRFEVSTAASIKMAVFWDVAPCRWQILTDLSDELAYHPDDGDSKLLGTICQYLPDYTVQRPRRQSSSFNVLLRVSILFCGTPFRSLSVYRPRRVSYAEMCFCFIRIMGERRAR